MKLTQKIILIAAVLALTSCSHLSSRAVANRDTAYLKARTIAPIQIPPGLNSETIEEEYPIADRTYPDSAKKVSLIPPEL